MCGNESVEGCTKKELTDYEDFPCNKVIDEYEFSMFAFPSNQRML